MFVEVQDIAGQSQTFSQPRQRYSGQQPQGFSRNPQNQTSGNAGTNRSVPALSSAGYSSLLTNRRMKAPMIIGSKYFLDYYSTVFEPDSAFVLGDGDFFFTFNINRTNSFGIDPNNEKKILGKNGNARNFSPISGETYSIYSDIEYTERFVKFAYGWRNSMEFSLVYRELTLGTGESFDNLIEKFHDLISVSNEDRMTTGQGNTEFYIYDNEKKQLVFSVSEPRSGYLAASWNFGFKYMFLNSASYALSLHWNTNFSSGDIHQLNEIKDSSLREDNPSSSNYGLDYSYVSKNFNLHFSLAQTQLRVPILPKLNKSIRYFSFAFNHQTFETVETNFQVIWHDNYFKAGEENAFGRNINVVQFSAGLRWTFLENKQLDVAILENQTQGAENIDVGFLASLNLTF